MMQITGTFLDEITYDIPPHNWGPEEWREEFRTMADAGLDTLVVIRSGLRDMACFPSETLGIRDVPDLLRFFLDEAERHNMSLFIGSYDSGTLSYEWTNWRHDWEINRRFVEEIESRYNGHPAFTGWYMANETVQPSRNAAELYTRIPARMKELSPDRPVLISPGYPSYVSRDDSAEIRHAKFLDGWDAILRQAGAVDICAFQDGSCAYANDSDQTFELERYLAETQQLCRAHDVRLWQNIETFSWKFPIKFPVIDWRYLQRKMRIAETYAEKLITFEFSHFLSPNSIFPSAQHLYRRYREQILDGKPFE